MIIKNLVVFLDARPASLLRLEIAAALALKYRAYLVAVFVELPPTMHLEGGSPESFARGTGLGGLITTYLSQELSTIQFQQHYLNNYARAHDLSIEWRLLPLHAQLRDAMVHARYADLTILGRPASDHAADNPFAWSSTDIVLSSGVPSLVIPEECKIQSVGEHIVIGWNASREARRAVSDAMSLLKDAQEVTVLVINPRINVTHHGEEPGADIAGHLARHGVRTAVERVEEHDTDAASVLVRRATELEADILVAGAYGHSRVSEFILGSATKTIITRSAMPILFSH